jgi:hypothetical protein
MRKMDLADRIAHCAFLGREFLLYLWWKSEETGGTFALPGFGEVTLTLETSMVLERKVDVVERTRLTGPDPSSGRTAKEALRHGELPTRVALRILHNEREYAFVLSEDLTLRTVKLPALLTDETDEQLLERLTLVATVESMLDTLFGEMLRLRLSPAFRAEVLPKMRAFARGEAA